MEQLLTVVTVLFVFGVSYSFVRVFWSDDMPNWLR